MGSPKKRKVKELKAANDLGYTRAEVIKMCKMNKLPVRAFWTEFGVNTCPILPRGVLGFFHWDVISTMERMLEGRKQHSWEWD